MITKCVNFHGLWTGWVLVASLCSAQPMRVPVGSISLEKPGSVTLLRPSGAKLVKVPCKPGTPIFAHDVLQLGTCPDLAIHQSNGVTQEFKDRGRHTVLRVESADEQASERLLAQYTRVMARPRGQTILDHAELPASMFAAAVDKPTVVVVSQAGLDPHRFLLSRNAQGRYTNANLEKWLLKMQDPNQAVTFTLLRPDLLSQAQEEFRIMSGKDEATLGQQVAKIDIADPVSRSLDLAVYFAKRRLFTVSEIYRKSAELYLTAR